jgi:hypothetical protein
MTREAALGIEDSRFINGLKCRRRLDGIVSMNTMLF